MATYAIDLPSGGSYEIEHDDDNLSQDQVLQILAQNLQGSTPRKAAAANIADNPNVGVGRVADEVTAGIAKSMTGLGAAARRMLPKSVGDTLNLPTSDDVETLRGVRDESNWAAVGDTGADIGATMVPLTKGTQLAQGMLRAAPHIPKAVAALGGAGAAGAGVGAVTHPDSASQGAVEGGLGAMAGEGIGMALRRLAGGIFRPSAEAKRLMDEGIQPSVGQAVDRNTLSGKMVAGVEGRLASTPVVGASMQNARLRPREEFIRNTIEKAIPKGGTMPDLRGGVDEALDSVKDQINSGYRALFDKVKIKVDRSFVQGMASEVQDVALKRNLNPTERAALRRVARNFLTRPNVDGATPYDLIATREELYKLATSSDSSKHLRTAAHDLRDRIGDWVGKNVPKGSAAEYQALNAKRTTLDRLMEAARKSATEAGEYSPDTLNRVLVKRADPALKQVTSDAAKTLENRFSSGRFYGGGGLNLTPPNLLSSAVTLGTTGRGTQRVLLGGAKGQAEAADAIRRITPALRQMMFEQGRSD
jgi:hypothetical protein